MKKRDYLLSAAIILIGLNPGNSFAIDIPGSGPQKPNPLDVPKSLEQPKTEDLSERIKITDIAFEGTDKKESVAIAMFIKPGDTVTPSQIKEDLQRIFGLGYFADVQATKEPYLSGYRLIIYVVENPPLKEVKVTGSNIVKSETIVSNFNPQIGKIINLNNIKESIENVRKIYGDKGYQAVAIEPQLSPEGVLTLNINEGIIEEINVVGNLETKNYVIMREIRQHPGDVFNIDIMREDLRRVYNTNFFENVDIKPSAGKKDPNHIIIDIVVKEKSTGNINLGAGYNTRDGIVGTFAVAKDNFLGSGQRVGLDLQLGAGWLSQTGTGANWLGKLDWYDPWFLPQYLEPRTGFGASIYRQRQGNFFQNVNQFNSSFAGGSTNFATGSALYNYTLINDRTGFSVNFSKAIFGDPLTSPWRTSLSVRAERIEPSVPRVEDVIITTPARTETVNGKPVEIPAKEQLFTDLQNSTNAADKANATKIKNEFNTYVKEKITRDLTVSKTGVDNRLALGLSLAYDTRDFVADPHEGWNALVSVEPSFGDVNYWKYFLTVNKYIPMPFIDKWTIALGSRLGVLTGDPSKISIYERYFSGGFDTIRGWPENGYLSGERVFVGSAEVRFPIYNIISGVAFFDFGNFWNQDWQVTDSNVNEIDPAVRKNEVGQFLRYGFGLGLRINTPLGALRADYGIRDITRPFDLARGAQFHFNIGQKF
jgi:outer membrane protein insertion porin family